MALFDLFRNEGYILTEYLGKFCVSKIWMLLLRVDNFALPFFISYLPLLFTVIQHILEIPALHQLLIGGVPCS